MSRTNDEHPVKPWHREYYVWMVIFFPMLAVVAGVYTIHLAITSDDGLVVDDYYKKGLEINRTLERDQIASSYDLKADVSFEPALKEVIIVLSANNEFSYPETIEAVFLNATRAGLDETARLIHTGDHVYRGQLPALTTGKWYLQLQDNNWRLSQELLVD